MAYRPSESGGNQYAYTDTMLWNCFDDGSVVFLSKAEKNINEHGKGVFTCLLSELVLHCSGCIFCGCHLSEKSAAGLVC